MVKYAFCSLALALSSGLSVEAKHWSKRDIPNGDGFVIPLTMDTKGRYVTTIGMGNNNHAGPIQKFPFVLSTSSPTTVVAGDACRTCVSTIGSANLYNATISTTEVNLNKTAQVSMGDGAIKGNSISESCGFLAKNGSYWWYPNQTVVVANDSVNFFANGAAGMLGMGRSSGSASLIDTIFRSHPAWQNLTIGIALDPKGADGTGNGVIDLTQPDPSLYEGELKFNPIVAAATDIPTNYPADWSLHLDSWTVDTGSVRTEHTTGGIAIVEPYFPEIRFPQEQATLFYQNVQGAIMNNDSDTGITWQIPCNPTLSLEVKFSGTPFTVPASQLVTNNGSGNCTGVVMAWDNPFVESYMLGSAFAQTVYMVYNAGRTNGNDSIGFAPRGLGEGGNSGLSSGAVAGISIGATLGFVALLAILFFWWRHKRAVRINNGEPIKEKKGQHKIDPFTPTSSSTPMFNLTTANGGEGRQYILEQGPIGGEVGQSTGLLSSVSPNSSPQTTTMSSAHRRKAEEAGLLAAGAGAAGLQVTNRRRPPSSQTNTTSTDFVQHLPPQPPTPATPATPDALLSQNHNLSSSSPDAQATQFLPEGLVRHISSGTGFNPRASASTAGHLLSPTSPQQIHYHIHLPPGAAATAAAAASNFPPGSIIHHEYSHDEPAPEYSERPATPAESSTAQHQAPT